MIWLPPAFLRRPHGNDAHGRRMSEGRRRRLALGLLVAVAFALAACAPDAAQDSLDPAGPRAREIDGLFNLVFWIAAGVFVLVEGLLVFALLRFRHRPGRDVPPQIHGSKKLELGWTLAPTLLLAIVAVPTVGSIFSLDRVPSGNVLQITVTGRQWWWSIEYPEPLGIVTANEIHVPVDVPVRLALTSPADRKEGVIHSFWIPRLAGKQDLFPGRITHLNLEADTPGRYEGQCVEFCGVSHANMKLLLFAHTAADFEAWVEGQQRAAAEPQAGSAAARGLEVFQQGGQSGTGPCLACHAIQGVEGAEARVGPDLTHFGSRTTFAGAMFETDTESLRDWLRDPPAVKPGSRMPDYDLTEEEIDALIAYLEGLE
jgi:cytochrome c oxidase subunit 2